MNRTIRVPHPAFGRANALTRLLAIMALICAAAALAAPAGAALYEVGPGKQYTSINAVPWENLAAGDTVRIYYRAAPYKEKFCVGVAGTASSPVLIQGVPGPNGELPVLDGDGATTRTQLDYAGDERAIIHIGATSVPAVGTTSYVTIENLDMKSARSPYTYTDDAGAAKTWSGIASAIRVVNGRDITIRNCRFRDSGNAFLTSPRTAAGNGAENITVEGCWFVDNGGDPGVHQAYTESYGMTYQYNRFDHLRAGCQGSNLKDRSSGQFIRYNWIEGGNREIDIPDSYDSSYIRSDPRYRQTYIYGNVIIEPAGDGIDEFISYGGDMGDETRYRKGWLYFYNNTVVSKRADSMTLFKLKTASESADCRNNVLYTAAAGNTFALMGWYGRLDITHNWMKTGWTKSLHGWTGPFNDDGTTVAGASPGFVNESAADYRLTAASPCVNAGTDLAAAEANYPPARQYVKHLGSEARPSDGMIDIGAYEYSGAAPLSVQTASLPDGVVGTPYSSLLSAIGGVTPYAWSLVSGALPSGLTLSTGGIFSGTPTADQSASFTVRAADSAAPSATATKALRITISPAPLVITTATLPDAKVAAAYNQTLAAGGGRTPYSWSRISGAGLSLSAAGVISGTPTASGTINFTVTVTDSQATPRTATKALSIYVAPATPATLAVQTASLPAGQAGAAYSQALSATGGVTPYKWSLSAGSLPAGLTLSTGGAVSGTPTVAGQSASFTVKVLDSATPAAATATKALSITINSAAAPTFQFASSDAESITTSTAWVNKTVLQWTPPASDDWVIIAFAEVKTTAGSTPKANLTIDGAAEALQIWRAVSSADWCPFITVKKVTFAASSHTVLLQYATGSASNAVSIRNARVVAIRRSGLEIFSAAAEAQAALTTTMAARATLTFTPAGAGRYLLLYSAEYKGASATPLVIRARLGATTLDESSATTRQPYTDWNPFASFAVADLAAAPQTLTIDAAKQGATSEYVRRCRIVAIRLTGGRFADAVYAASDAASTTASTAWQQKAASSWTTGSDNRWLFLESARIGTSNASYPVEARSQMDNVTTLATQTRRPNLAGDWLAFGAADVRDVNDATRFVDIDYRSTNAAATAKVKYAHFLGIPLD